MKTLKNTLLLTAILVCYGIAGRMDRIDAERESSFDLSPIRADDDSSSNLRECRDTRPDGHNRVLDPTPPDGLERSLAQRPASAVQAHPGAVHAC
jgi:hypothetical protein